MIILDSMTIEEWCALIFSKWGEAGCQAVVHAWCERTSMSLLKEKSCDRLPGYGRFAGKAAAAGTVKSFLCTESRKMFQLGFLEAEMTRAPEIHQFE